uniref:ATPase AAA-type core domain-containing protein n=2 Tax=Proboscia inermis TaxID=420281 RepID=A0A7S0C3Q1_9STRA|mmetsp:Transcript_25127/g.25597  ORF Transcript_25127/g.25597 Transcript_25127/m.25597 type:complete len:153 (+) Transcript_25127:1-459(+)
MLRLLEYYSGCLFLSSNRSAERIDDAIASRITVMLGYPALNESGREQVWKNLIELVPTQPKSTTNTNTNNTTNNTTKSSRYRLEFTPQNYQTLANGYDLNGRQIKNSIVLARALSRERKLPLDMTILHRAVMAVAGEKAQAAIPKFEIGDYH